MPWRSESAVDLREAFVRSCLSDGANVSELCRHYGISRVTGHKWLRRFEAEGLPGLADRSRAPHGNARSVSAEVEALLVAERARHGDYGAGKLLARLAERHPAVAWPARSTAHEVLRRHGLVEHPRRRRPQVDGAKRGVEADRPNAVWSADFKGEFRLGDGTVCYPLTVSDGYSRYLLACTALENVRGSTVIPCFEALFRERGLPESILTDNGPPFASSGVGGLTQLSVLWLKLGIVVDRSRPGKPQDNGRHERMHRTLKKATTRPAGRDLASQEARFAEFVREYNEEQPHEALGQVPPARVYAPSPRAWEGEVPKPEYPSHWVVRQVRRAGEIHWRGGFQYVGAALRGEPVGLFETGDGVWQVAFCSHPLGIYDERTDKLTPVRPRARARQAHRGFTATAAQDAEGDGQGAEPRPHP